KGGVLRLGTEVVSDDEGTVAALLGASPGASTAAPIMLQLMEKEKKFVTAGLGDDAMLRYNSKLPIVVYTPSNVDVKYRIWRA
ncbi:malate:quinone oxidoreductase, partial [Klebsiella pneumoniae]|uniref:malate:quinone oxidoreductase n=1 Tax=Klebsiella pneumoniae TaxID=573 RepID=UPI00214C243C